MEGIKVEICDKKCVECSFLRDGLQDTLTPDFMRTMIQGVLFPCHLVLKEFSGSENTGTGAYVKATGSIKVCRGYVEAKMKSGFEPENNVWQRLYDEINQQGGVKHDTMYVDEAMLYHQKSIFGRK